MELNLELAKQGTLKFLNKTSFSLFNPQFEEYDFVYLFTSENNSYLEKIDVKDKDVLTVTGSFDQCLNLVFEGAKSVCNFDVNLLTIFLAKFKMAALKTFSYQEYLDFFLGEDRFAYNSYLKLRDNLEPIFREYWDFIYETFSYSNKAIMESRLFDKPTFIENTIASNPYLKSEENYELTRQRIDDVDITFEKKNVLEIGDGSETYDLMLFSNIETYLVGDNKLYPLNEEEFLDFIENKASKQLNDDGVIQMAYNYQYQWKVKKEKKIGFLKVNTAKKMYKKREYLESYEKIMFTGLPLHGHLKISEDVKDCVYLYKKNTKNNSKTR